MKVGDLVVFHSSFRKWKEDYVDRNPGVVTDANSQRSAEVLWCNGDRTTEHASFLVKVASNVVQNAL